MCRLVVGAGGKTYQSLRAYPCSMVEDPERSLGTGVCFGALPPPAARALVEGARGHAPGHTAGARAAAAV
jgi:hypothetical protein